MSPPPADAAAAFMAVATAAMEDLQRARVQSGVARGDPLDPLIGALARTVGVLGQMPAALAQQQAAAEEAAIASLGAALAAALRDLVAEAGAAAARAYQARWIATAAAVIATCILAAGVGGWWIGRSEIEAAMAAERVRFEGLAAQMRAEMPASAAWAGIIPTGQRQLASWALEELHTPADHAAAEWGVSREGRLAQQWHLANTAAGGIPGLAACLRGETERQQGRTACVRPPPYWVVE